MTNKQKAMAMFLIDEKFYSMRDAVAEAIEHDEVSVRGDSYKVFNEEEMQERANDYNRSYIEDDVLWSIRRGYGNIADYFDVEAFIDDCRTDGFGFLDHTEIFLPKEREYLYVVEI